MGTSSQLHDSAMLKLYPHLAQRYCFWTGFKRNLWQGPELPFKTITENLRYNSTNCLRVTLSQYSKAFVLSATTVAY